MDYAAIVGSNRWAMKEPSRPAPPGARGAASNRHTAHSAMLSVTARLLDGRQSLICSYETERISEDSDRFAHNLEIESWPVRGVVGGFGRTP